MKQGFFIFSLILILMAAPAYAGVVITEIMYDLEGADTGREWIEIKNTGSSQADLTGWKLFEANTNHGITATNPQTFILPAGAYAVIADNVEKFLVDWPNFSGTLFDSVFSLSNTGETIGIRNSEPVDIDSVSYSSSWGAAGDGNSLQKVNNEWIAVVPTLGAGQADTSNESSPAAQEESATLPSGSVPPLPVNQIKAYAGPDRAGIAGGEIFFEGFAEGLRGDPLDGARFSWNFGDGIALADGKKIIHTFLFPGVYTVSLNVSAGEYSALDTAIVTVSDNPLIISELKPGPEGWVEIKNNSARKIEISRFGFVESNSKPFFFSENTFLAPWALVVLSTSTLGFILPESGEAKLLYPNGKVIFSSSYPNLNLGTGEGLSFNGERWLKTKTTPGTKNETIKSAAPPARSAIGGASQNVSSNAGTVKTSELSGPQNLNASVIDAGLPWKNYFWLFIGLGAGLFGGLAFVLIRSRFTL